MDDFYYSTANEQPVTQFLKSSTSNASMWPSTFYFELFHFFILLKIELRQSRAVIHLEAVLPSPPARVLFRRHVYDGHDVSHLRRRETDGQSKVKRIQNHQEIKSSVGEVSPRRSTHRWPGPCSAWWRGRQRWPGRWWRPPLTPADGSPCCQSGKDVRQDRI